MEQFWRFSAPNCFIAAIEGAFADGMWLDPVMKNEQTGGDSKAGDRQTHHLAFVRFIADGCHTERVPAVLFFWRNVKRFSQKNVRPQFCLHHH